LDALEAFYGIVTLAGLVYNNSHTNKEERVMFAV
jgi:hypothetical protein